MTNFKPLKENYLLDCYHILALDGCSEHVSAAENGAERAKKLVSVSGTFEERAEREIGERERNDERAMSSVTNFLKACPCTPTRRALSSCD
jgi:hypothetical protein